MSDYEIPWGEADDDKVSLDALEPPCAHEYGHIVCQECGLTMPTAGRHGIVLDPETAFD